MFPALDHTWSLGTNSWICSPRGNSTLSCTNLVTRFITFPSCSICCEISSPLTWGKFVDTCFIMGGGPPYTVLSGEEPWDCGSSWVWAEPSETNPPRSSQSLRSAWRVSSRVRLVPSTIPELWGLYAVSNFHLMFKVLLTCYTKSATEAGPWSDPMLVGNPNLGTISLSRHQATSDVRSVQVGKASTHPENVHTVTSR